MTADMIVAGSAALGVLAYLFYTLLRPERF
ncbi:MAG TPA: potassium-transporting ATPase subunit F [Ramlibacter sp.]|nr:potassium-transporting ATPase subunit F [Ramlibacter sp.]